MARTTIGLDIGTSAVRAAEVRAGDPPALLRFAQLGLPPGAVVGGEIADADAVAGVVRDLWKRAGFKTKHVSVAVANQGVVVRQVELPRMDEADLKGALQFQVQDYIPIPIEDAMLDFLPLEEYVAPDGAEMMRVLAVAAQKDMINAFVVVVQRAGLDPVGIDIAPLAAIRALAETPGLLDERDAVAIVDIGAGVTNVVLHEHRTPRLVRILPSGGNDITAALMTELGISADEAETQKIAIGLSEDGSPLQPGAAGVIEQRARAFMEDVRSSLDYYRSQADAARIARVVLTGGGSRMPRLRERLSTLVHVPVEDGHPFVGLNTDAAGLTPEQLQQAEAVAAVAVGLALEDER